MSFRAKYPGHCEHCDERIMVGQLVEYTADNRLAHVICPDDLDSLTGLPLPVCPQCFMTLPRTGLCDCRE